MKLNPTKSFTGLNVVVDGCNSVLWKWMRIGVSREWTYHMQESLMQQSVKRVTRGAALSNRGSHTSVCIHLPCMEYGEVKHDDGLLPTNAASSSLGELEQRPRAALRDAGLKRKGRKGVDSPVSEHGMGIHRVEVRIKRERRKTDELSEQTRKSEREKRGLMHSSMGLRTPQLPRDVIVSVYTRQSSTD
ncbi:hypothetical protein KQX54_007033 [Cotesia glomerata]|uniref:Uncharacterized protein n=1 Tax=Cotesia glomerata TaxID=32391 RepID=A0AAV7J3F5_COTGL|nr:hypothetical protein KQX54_007033 [Cotesia glomerata]